MYCIHMATVVLIVKISFIRFEDKLYTFFTLCLRILFTFHIYLIVVLLGSQLVKKETHVNIT